MIHYFFQIGDNNNVNWLKHHIVDKSDIVVRYNACYTEFEDNAHIENNKKFKVENQRFMKYGEIERNKFHMQDKTQNKM